MTDADCVSRELVASPAASGVASQERTPRIRRLRLRRERPEKEKERARKSPKRRRKGGLVDLREEEEASCAERELDGGEKNV